MPFATAEPGRPPQTSADRLRAVTSTSRTTDLNSKGRPSGGPSLNYTNSDELSISRRRCGRGWAYYDASGARISDRLEINRLNRLALPPAYSDARFNPDPFGHLQAVGTDARGRRQYRYHPDFRSAQEADKYSACIDFALALPRLRRRLAAGLCAPPTSREAVIAAMIRILDQAYLRIGNEAYRRDNKSFGLTTLRNRHARLGKTALELEYRGKAGIVRKVRLNDRSLTRIVRRCQDLPGQQLFQFVDQEGIVRAVKSGDVNAYIRDAMDGPFTAKHFRTWHASAIAFEARREGLALKEILDRVSNALGNTPAIARKAYIHPIVIETPVDELQRLRLPRATQWQSRAERGLLELLSSTMRCAA